MAGNSVLAKMAVQIVANNAQFAAAMKQSQAQMMGFQKTARTMNTALAGIGVGFGLMEFARGVQYTIGVMADFQRNMSEVKAITGATGDEFKALEGDAKRLGGSTKFTASEVAKLQVAYGRLGFNTQEILDATEATLSLAAATGEDLAKSADVAGSTVRGFGLEAEETLRVVDVMASSFNKTALGLENFTESMKYVAPIANAAGASVEETTAMLGVLADAGVRGSQAGTSLRKIFTDMTKDGRPLQERLAELAKKGITLSDSFDEVGRTAQTALLILSKNTEKTSELTKELQNASGEAAKMATVMEDNLTGDTIKLTSAIDGLILKFSEGTGPMRDFVQNLTAFVNLMAQDKVVKFLKDWLSLVSIVPRKTLEAINWLRDLTTEEDDEFTKMQKSRRAKWEASLKQQNEVNEATKQGTQALKEYAEVIETLPAATLSQTAQRVLSGSAGPTGVTTAAGIGSIIPLDNDAIFQKMEALRNKSAEVTDAVAQDFLDMSGLVAGSIVSFASGLGAAIAGTENFGDVILQTIGGFMQSFGASLIAMGVGKIALEKFSGPAMIAAGFALTAAGSALSASMRGPNVSSGGGSGSSRGISRFAANSSVQNSSPQLITVLKGEDMWIMLQNYEAGKRYTGG